MDDPDIHTSPRKKLKMHVEPHHQLPNVSSSTSTAPSADISGMANLDPRAQPSSDGLQFSKEAEVGILEFISPDLPGFSGILKQRYTDFLVNEILPSGEVIHLTDLNAPTSGRKQEAHPQTEQNIAKAAIHSAVGVTAHAKSSGTDVDTIGSTPGGEQREEPIPKPAVSQHQVVAEPQLRENARQHEPEVLPAAKIHLDSNETRTNFREKIQDADIGMTEPEPNTPIVSGSPEPAKALKNIADSTPAEDSVPTEIDLHDENNNAPSKHGWIIKDIDVSDTLQQNIGSQHAPKAARRKVVTVMYKNEKPDAQEKQEKQENGAAKAARMNVKSTIGEWQAYANKPPAFQLKPEDEETLKSVFDPDTVSQLLALFNRAINSPHRKVHEYGIVTSPPIADRELRTKIHQDIRRIFASRLESYTAGNGVMTISVAIGPNKWGTQTTAQGGPYLRNPPQSVGERPYQSRDSRPDFKELGGPYLHVSLYKENKDTMEVISYLARQLHIPVKSFQFAGTKDRRAVTVQRISVFRVFASRMVAVGRTLRGAKVGNYDYRPAGLELGELAGNEFVIALRDCQFPDQVGPAIEDRLSSASKIVGAAAKHLNEHGFINYYGLQRFGTFTTRTDTVGLKMLQGDFKGAVESILEFAPATLAAANDRSTQYDRIASDDIARATAIHKFQISGESAEALSLLPRKFSAESTLIRSLGRPDHASDYFGALQGIPRNLRLMYVHAYQSLIWNLAASYRWKQYKGVLLEGDLVLVNDHKGKHSQVVEQELLDTDGEVIVQPATEDSSTHPDDRFVRARALSKDEVESGKYSIYDVVLPLPGYDVSYPAYMTGFYENTMGSERYGGLDPHDMRRRWKEMSLSGSYRKLLARPAKGLTFEVRAYSHTNEQFVETDAERLNNDARQADSQQGRGGQPSGPQDGIRQARGQAKANGRSNYLNGNEQQIGNEPHRSHNGGDYRGHGQNSRSQDIRYQNIESQDTRNHDSGRRDIDSQTMASLDIRNHSFASQDIRFQNIGGQESRFQVPNPSSRQHRNQAIGTTSGEFEDNRRQANGGDVVTMRGGGGDPATNPEEKKIAIILKFQLGPSQYATMALRELMKLGGVKAYKPDFGIGH